jgi:alpha-L-arabinofuranosidase
MVKHNIIKLSIMILTIAILGTTGLIIIPANMAYAQGTIGDIISNMTQGNMTQGNMTQSNTTQVNPTQGNITAVIDVDTLAKNIKERHPILTQMSADEDHDLMVKIKGMDPKEAAKTTIALNMLRLLQQYKQLDVE